MDTSLTRDTNTCGDVCFNILLHMPLEIITDCHMAWTPPCNVLTIYWTKTLLYHFAKNCTTWFVVVFLLKKCLETFK